MPSEALSDGMFRFPYPNSHDRTQAAYPTESIPVIEENPRFPAVRMPASTTPSAEEVAQWRDILAARGGKFLRLSKICQTWLDEEAA